ncbi:MAG: IS110 family transposase [Elusimicrobia bacterium]|nr:IS110 family transposase [Elusimicrobiota bacterium]
MRLNAAIDLHSNNSVLVILDEKDRVVHEGRHPNDLKVILAQLSPYREDVQAIAVESTYNWYWLVDGLMEAGYDVKLVNTVAVKTYDGLKYTSDEHDAKHLAHLLNLGILPTGYIYPKKDRAVRDLLRKRSQLVRHRTAHILSVQNLTSRNRGNGMTMEKVYKLDDKGVAGICGGDASLALAMQSNLVVLRCLEEQVHTIERAVLKQARLKPQFKKLLTVDGIGEILGMTIMYEAGDMKRFEQVGHFASYSRCVTSSRWSNGKKKGTGNRKNGNKYLGWAFVEAAHHAVRYNERIRKFYQRKKARTNGIVALKAIAHKLARACYHVIKEQAVFDETKAFA